MYKEAGFGADQYFEAEASKLVEKASKWEAAGADTLQVEEWLYDQLGQLSEDAWGRGEEAASLYLDSVQAQSRTLVDEFNGLQDEMTTKLDEVAGKAADLDGTEIGLIANFNGTAVMTGLDQLIDKFRALKEAANNAESWTQEQGGADIGQDDNGARSSGSTTINNNTSNNYFDQKQSRSDIVNFTEEQKRQEARS